MLKQRVITATIGVIIVAAVLASGFQAWFGLVWLVSLLCVSEFTGMLGLRMWHPLAVFGYLCASVLIFGLTESHGWVLEALLGVGLMIPVALRNQVTINVTATTFVGALYIGFGGESLVELRHPDHGLAWILLVLICIWTTDTAAFFAGRALKGPLLWPAISPKKTVSGAVAGVLAAAGVSILAGAMMLGTYPWVWFALFGAVISVTGQIGDFVESAYKRSAGVKDSGRLLPGHGGFLDRIDSLLFAAPFAVLLIHAETFRFFA